MATHLNGDCSISLLYILSSRHKPDMQTSALHAHPSHSSTTPQAPPANDHLQRPRQHRDVYHILTRTLASLPAAAPTTSSITHGTATARTVHPTLRASSSASRLLPLTTVFALTSKPANTRPCPPHPAYSSASRSSPRDWPTTQYYSGVA